MRSARRTSASAGAASSSPEASTKPTAEALPKKYTCKPCNRTILLINKSEHEASKRHLNAPITCNLCNVSYGKECHDAHIVGKKHLAHLGQDIGKKHLAHLGQDIAPGLSWDRPTKKPLGNGVAPRRLGDGIGVIRLVPAPPQAAEPVLWRCGVCATTMAVGLRANHQNRECAPAWKWTGKNPIRGQVNADKRAEAKKKARQEYIESGRQRKGDRGGIWGAEDDDY